MIVFLFLQEQSRALIRAPGEIGIEQTVFNLVQWLKLGVEVTGAIVIVIGIVAALLSFSRSLIQPQLTRYNEIRLLLSRFLALALEFQLGADILSTAIAPSWDQIGKLGAIAFIRTVLNYFLTREMIEERAGVNADPFPTGNIKSDEPNAASENSKSEG